MNLLTHLFGFSSALELLKKGDKVARSGWNGKGMFIFMVPAAQIIVVEGRPLSSTFRPGSTVRYCAHIDMLTVNRSVVPWLASQTDLLAEDWYVVKE
jgi:hypothetical protein